MTTLEQVLRKFNLDPAGTYDGTMPLTLPHFSRGDLAQLFADLGFKRGAEIGVETGLYSEVLCKANPGLKLYCVDAWQAYRGYREHVTQAKLDGFLDRARTRLENYDVELFAAFSMEAVESDEFADNNLDFVFIDGNHGFDWVMQDIIEWSKRVRPGGIVSGHDYFRPKNNDDRKYGVIEAVNAYTQARNVRPWFVARGDDPKAPSWFWLKQ